MEKNYLSTSLLDYKQQHRQIVSESSPTIHQQNLLSLWEHQPQAQIESQTIFVPDCGYKEHRDINAANNIFIKGLSLFVVGNTHADLKE
ncbi:hypothetical protein Kyoto90A_07090 [Helicobacter pylori]